MLWWTSFISASDKALQLQGHARPAYRIQAVHSPKPWLRQRQQEQERGCWRQKRSTEEGAQYTQPAPRTGQVKSEGLEGVLSGRFTWVLCTWEMQKIDMYFVPE